jgi:DNA/RNA-binding domain of Phe-tRNA-synthetase-like protein
MLYNKVNKMAERPLNEDLRLYIIACGNSLRSYAGKNQTPDEGIISFADDLFMSIYSYNQQCPISEELTPNMIIPSRYLFSANP